MKYVDEYRDPELAEGVVSVTLGTSGLMVTLDQDAGTLDGIER